MKAGIQFMKISGITGYDHADKLLKNTYEEMKKKCKDKDKCVKLDVNKKFKQVQDLINEARREKKRFWGR